jgi:hypothetical protein
MGCKIERLGQYPVECIVIQLVSVVDKRSWLVMGVLPPHFFLLLRPGWTNIPEDAYG